MHKCKYCGKEFENGCQLGGHITRCKLNPNVKPLKRKILPINEYTVNCKVCGKQYKIKCNEVTYNKKLYRKTCSSFCSHKLTAKNSAEKLKNKKIAKCIDCGKEIKIYSRASDKTCRCEKCKKLHTKYIKHSIITEYELDKNNRKTVKERKEIKCKICGKFGCTKCSKKYQITGFKKLIKYFGFDESKLGTPEVWDEYNRIRDMLIDLYHNQKESLCSIGKKFNYDPANLAKTFKSFEIPRRNNSEANKIALLTHRAEIRDTRGFAKHQWHTTWNNKKFYLRSSYELDYAKELDEKQIDYEVEKIRIKYWDSQRKKFRCAVPDFYIPLENLIVEIKSEYILDKQNMIDKKNAYIEQGYKFKLICDHIEIEI